MPLSVRENATWQNGKETLTWQYLFFTYGHVRPASPAVPPLYFFYRAHPNPSLFLVLLPRTYPYSNPWLPSTLPILPSHHHHHHHHILLKPPFHLARRPPRPSLQQNLALPPHPTTMVLHLESGPGLA
jgi:hypothetical protein